MKTNRMRSIATFAPMMMLAAAACTAEVDESQGFEDELVGTDEQALITDGQVCINVQRGASGAVEDATLWQSAPTWNDGASARISTGTSESGGYSRSLLRFDLSAVPAGATVVSADLSLRQVYKNGPSAAIDVLRATAPWSEGAVTWNSFGGAFDPSPVGSFTAAGDGGEGLRTIDVRDLAQDWVSGAAPNHGVVIDGPTDTTRTELRSSDSPQTGERPALALCYTTCDDGVQNGEETGVDCGGPNCGACPSSGLCGDGVCQPEDGENWIVCPDDCPSTCICGTGVCEPECGENAYRCPADCTTFTCYDGVQNGEETGVDCGGPNCGACPASGFCGDGTCQLQDGESPLSCPTDCAMSCLCGDGVCQPQCGENAYSCPADCTTSTCYDGVQNGEESGVDCGGPHCSACDVSGSFSYYAWYNTYYATQNTTDLSISLPGGAIVVISTCASFWGDTYLRLTTPSGTTVAENDNGCSLGSYLYYQVPANAGGTYVIRAGCYGSGACGGTVSYAYSTQ